MCNAKKYNISFETLLILLVQKLNFVEFDSTFKRSSINLLFFPSFMILTKFFLQWLSALVIVFYPVYVWLKRYFERQLLQLSLLYILLFQMARHFPTQQLCLRYFVCSYLSLISVLFRNVTFPSSSFSFPFWIHEMRRTNCWQNKTSRKL